MYFLKSKESGLILSNSSRYPKQQFHKTAYGIRADFMIFKSCIVCHAGKEGIQMKEKISNSQMKDTSSKLIFSDPILCAQFLRGYVDIPLLKNVQPEDIEDVTNRYLHMFTEERNSDSVSRIRTKINETPFFIVSLIEYKSNVDY